MKIETIIVEKIEESKLFRGVSTFSNFFCGYFYECTSHNSRVYLDKSILSVKFAKFRQKILYKKQYLGNIFYVKENPYYYIILLNNPEDCYIFFNLYNTLKNKLSTEDILRLITL